MKSLLPSLVVAAITLLGVWFIQNPPEVPATFAAAPSLSWLGYFLAAVLAAPFAKEFASAWWSRAKGTIYAGKGLVAVVGQRVGGGTWKTLVVGMVVGAVVAMVGAGLLRLPDWKWRDWIDDVVVVDPPAPIPGSGLMILVAEETNDRNSYTPGQRDAILATTPGSLRAYAAEKCIKVGGAPAFRVLDKDDFADLSREQQWVRDAAKSVDLTKLPFVVVSNGKTGDTFQAKPEAADTIAAIKKFEGK